MRLAYGIKKSNHKHRVYAYWRGRRIASHDLRTWELYAAARIHFLDLCAEILNRAGIHESEINANLTIRKW